MPTATELVKNWGQFLDQVRAGTSFGITVHGRQVARLLPPPREANQAELRAYLDSLPHSEAVEAALAAAVAELDRRGLALDAPYQLRAASALATGAYSAGGVNADEASERKKAFRAAVAAAGRQKWEAYKKAKAAASGQEAAA